MEARESLLASTLAAFAQRGWNPADLATFRMEGEGTGGGEGGGEGAGAGGEGGGEGAGAGGEGGVTDWEAEAKKWQELSRKNETRAKANAQASKELEQLKQQGMNDTDKAVAQAKSEARIEALREVASDNVELAVRAAATGRNVDVDALIEGVDRARFITDEHKVDVKAISEWIDRVAPKASTDLGQGARGGAALGSDMNALIRSRMNR